MRRKHNRVLRLRQLRRERELTQAEISKRVGITINAYSAIEHGRAVPRLDTAERIASVFGLPVEHVFVRVDVPVLRP